MQITEHTDSRGGFLRVVCPDGKAFLLDAIDRAYLDGKPWKVFSSRGYDSCQYVVRTSGGKTQLLHREIMRAPKGVTVDHEDWDGLNDRRYNLRLATVHQNHSHIRWGRGGRGILPASGLRGAYQDKYGGWYSTISWHDKQISLGRFASAEDAARAWDKKARELRGEFTYLNFPDEVEP